MLHIEEYISTIQSNNTKKVIESVLLNVPKEKRIGDISVIELEKIILDLKPSSPKAIITICYVLSLYAKYCDYNETYQKIQSLNRKVLWLKAKPNAPKKYISHEQYLNLIHDIGVYEEMNGFYYQTLFKTLYNGVYNDDLSVLDNLTTDDIKDNSIILKPDYDKSYRIEVSEDLINDLKELSEINTWQRKNRYGYFEINITGKYKNSCFKIENRSGEYKSFRFSYYAKLRKISKDYLNYNLLPLQIYISGIMYRIRLELDKNHITLRQAFKEENRDRTVNNIIENELKRCGYDISVRNFREIVKGHIDIFEK